MKNRSRVSSVSVVLAAVLCAVTVFSACSGNKTTSSAQTASASSASASSAASSGASSAAATELGQGKMSFTFQAVLQDGTATDFVIHTDEKTVGDALLKVELIAGEKGEYGLYVKTVNGVTADYDKDKTYWAFYVNGQYATTGVDATDVADGASYAFKIQK